MNSSAEAVTPAGPLPAPATGGGPAVPRRAAARRLATGVCVLTAAHQGAVHGTTVSAVGAVSRDPLLISVCLRNGSTFTELARKAGTFTAGLLTSRQALVADWFANPARTPNYGQFALLDWQPDPVTGAPALRNTLATLSCRITACHPAGDHELLIAEVTEGSNGAGSPLLNFDGRLFGAEIHEVNERRSNRHDPDRTSARALD
ncbi:flavin reductase family protein [Streptomyces sp. NPDC051320]|uniref:flavin reductase family protein n=1 Tax=Streptomyces sp. NPDC051320 TaxID=3154644 RepID=UPI00343FC50A